MAALAFLSQRSVYTVTDDSPTVINQDSVGLTARHLVKVHDLSSKSYEIQATTIAKLSLYNLEDVTVSCNTKVLSSTIEVSRCTGVTLTFPNAPQIPSIIQIDPEINGLYLRFPSLTEIEENELSLVVSPQITGQQGLGLAKVVASVGEVESVLIDDAGHVHPTLLERIAGRELEDQYLIKLDGSGRWTMHGVNKKEGIPDLAKLG